MKTEQDTVQHVRFTDGSHDFICTEHQQNGFTNHRVCLIANGKAFSCTDSRFGQHTWHFEDLLALEKHLSFGRCLAHTHLAACYRAAFEFARS